MLIFFARSGALLDLTPPIFFALAYSTLLYLLYLPLSLSLFLSLSLSLSLCGVLGTDGWKGPGTRMSEGISPLGGGIPPLGGRGSYGV